MRLRERVAAFRHGNAAAVLLLLAATFTFYYRITLGTQFSMLTEGEGVNQSFSWLQHWIRSVRSGSLPLWDMYTFSGRSFAGEMQTAVFYPVHLLLAAVPSGSNYTLSPAVYHWFIAFNHFLGAAFMFALLRELDLGRFAAFIGGICFSLGGFVARMPWPHMLESSIWLPLIVLFTLRAVRSGLASRVVLNASCGGLALGLSILAGGLHVAIMQVMITVFLCGFLWATPTAGDERRRVLITGVAVCATGLMAGAAQLVASAEYSSHALRFLGAGGAVRANAPIPYDLMQDGLTPNAFLSLLIPMGFNGAIGVGEVVNPYAGVLPLLFAAIGVWANWRNRFVRFCVLLAVVAFLYAMGALSPLHGFLYTVVPRLWLAREAGRIVYAVSFSLAVLAAFGAQYLFSSSAGETLRASVLSKAAAALAIASGAALFVESVLGRSDISAWVQFSLLMILLAYALYRYILAGHISTGVKALATALILFDLSAFDWSAANKREVRKSGTDHFERLYSARGAVEFLRSRPGPFRVEVDADPRANVGNFFGVETTLGAGATIPADYAGIMGRVDLLNIRYRLKPASVGEEGAIWSDRWWRVYEVPEGGPRAWLVHRTKADSDQPMLPEFDSKVEAVVDKPLSLGEPPAGSDDRVEYTRLTPEHLRIKVRAAAAGLLVISEMHYPGWEATVNGAGAAVLKANRALSSLLVPQGDSEVVLRYRPVPIYAGGLLSALTFAGVIAACCVTAFRAGGSLVPPQSSVHASHAPPPQQARGESA